MPSALIQPNQLYKKLASALFLHALLFVCILVHTKVNHARGNYDMIGARLSKPHIDELYVRNPIMGYSIL